MHFKFGLTALAVLVSTLASPIPDDSALLPRATFELFPNLIINVDRADPAASSAAGYIATISTESVSLFSFDIPYDISPTCTLTFQLPPPGGLFRDTVEGSGNIDVVSIEGVFGTPTSYSAVSPLLGASDGTLVASLGAESSIVGVPCSAGSTFQVALIVADGEVSFFERQSPTAGLSLIVSY